MSLNTFSDQQILNLIGERLRRGRLRQDLTQAQLAERSGIATTTIQSLEQGKGRLDSLVSTLRALNQLNNLEQFLPDPGISPLQVAKSQGKIKQRASGKRDHLNLVSNNSTIKNRDIEGGDNNASSW